MPNSVRYLNKFYFSTIVQPFSSSSLLGDKSKSIFPLCSSFLIIVLINFFNLLVKASDVGKSYKEFAFYNINIINYSE